VSRYNPLGRALATVCGDSDSLQRAGGKPGADGVSQPSGHAFVSCEHSLLRLASFILSLSGSFRTDLRCLYTTHAARFVLSMQWCCLYTDNATTCLRVEPPSLAMFTTLSLCSPCGQLGRHIPHSVDTLIYLPAY